MTFAGLMTLECPDCARAIVVLRDPSDPPRATLMKIVCPQCDDGDFHTPAFFDPDGNRVNPVEHLEAA